MKKKMIVALGLSLVVTANTSNIVYAAPVYNKNNSNKQSKVDNKTTDAKINVSNINNQNNNTKTMTDKVNENTKVSVSDIKGNSDNKKINVNNLDVKQQVNNANVKQQVNNTNVKQQVSKKKESLDKNTKLVQQINPNNTEDIEFYNIWGGQALKLDFNVNTMKIEATRQSGDLGSSNSTYMKLFLYNSKNNEVEMNQDVPSTTTENLANMLNGKSFNFGDVIGIDFESNYNPIISGEGSIPNNGKMNYYKITKDGLIAYTPDVTINPFDVLTGAKVTSGDITGEAVPSTNVSILVNGQTFTGTTNSDGKFNIHVSDEDGFTKSTIVKVTMESEIGAITKYTTPSLSKSVTLVNSGIQVINGWGSLAGLIKFNPLTMSLSVSQYNQYLGHNSNDFLNINVYNPATGNIEYSGAFKGNDNTSVLSNAINGMKFNYGDIIGISYDSSQGHIDVDNSNQNQMNSNGKEEYFEVTQKGLVKSTLPKIQTNPLAILGSGETTVTKATLTGIAKANEEVTVMLNGNKYTTTANSSGKFSIDLIDTNGFTLDTKIMIFAKGMGISVISPVLENNVSIQNSSIQVVNHWGSEAGLINFNPLKMSFSVSQYNGYLGYTANPFLNLVVYNPNETKILYSGNLAGNDNTSSLDTLLNNRSFEYGDIIGLSYDSSQGKVEVTGQSGNEMNTNGDFTCFEITKEGLVKSQLKTVQVNPLTILGAGKTGIKEATLTGKAMPNQKVVAVINGQTFSSMSDSNGNFSMPIKDTLGFTTQTKIEVFSKGENITFVSPQMEQGIKLQDSTLKLIDAWGNPSGVLGFNPVTMTLETKENYNKLYMSNATDINISLCNTSTGDITSNLNINSSTSTSAFDNMFAKKAFNYGDVIKVSTSEQSETNFEVLNGNNLVINQGNTKNNTIDKYYQITKGGLTVYTPKLIVNPFEVLDGQGKTTGTITGTAIAGSNVVIEVNNNKFEGKANSEGKFSINIKDTTPFTGTTQISVWSKGCVKDLIYPIAPTNLGLGLSKLQLNNNSLGIAQTMVFNPTTMKVENSGDSFAAQLISPDNGEVISSLATGNFNVFSSLNNLNGSTFKYGDIITLYESEETSLSDGKIMLLKGKSKEYIDAISQFKSFKITPNGLVPIGNKDLTGVNATFTGDGNVLVTGKTTPNTKVTLYYSKNKTKVITSNDDGVFSENLPVKDATIGSEVRVFVNNDNLENVIVKYDSKMFNTNNSIQIVNNEAFPVINITFAPATQKINAMVYPRDKTYAGVFYGNRMNISLLDATTGEPIKSVTSARAGEIESYAKEFNGTPYKEGDILKIQYDNNLVSVNVFDNKKEIGNTSGTTEYFEITNKGFENVTDKFINMKPLDILGSGKVTSTDIKGKVSPNETVTAKVGDNTFTTTSDASGNFTLNVKDANGFTSSTNIIVAANGYIPTSISPKISSSIKLVNSYINFYQNSFNWEITGLCSSIGFDVNNNTFYVNNYSDTFGSGKSNYFTLYLYNQNGVEQFSKAFTGESTKDLADFIGGKSFAYGDIIGLKFDPSVYKPVAINGNTAIGNVTGAMEYFKITKDGLVKVNFGNRADAIGSSWNNGSLNISTTLGSGNSSDIKNSNKKIVILDSNNNIVAQENATTENKDGETLINGTLTSSDLSKITLGKDYTLALSIGNKIIPLYATGNIESSNDYSLYGSSNVKLTISKKEKPIIKITNSDELGVYQNSLENTLSNMSIATLGKSSIDQNKVLALEFINRVGLKNLKAMYSESAANANFINWVLNNSTAMQEFLGGPNPEGPHLPEGQPAATYAECVQVWSNIWNAYTNSHSGFNLKLAIAVSLSNGKQISSFPSGAPVGSPVQRYDIFEKLAASGGMIKGFENYDVSHLCYVTNTSVANNQIIPMRNIILQNHNGLIKANMLNNIAYTIHYNVKNPHTGVSVFGPNFYGKNPTVKTVWYDGGVCGATGWLGGAGEQVFGIPATDTPQPGHNAFIYYNSENNTWNIGNMVDGWSHTADSDMSSWSDILHPSGNYIASYTLLYQNADTKELKESNMYLYLANSSTQYTTKIAAVNKAIEVQPLNLGAWIELVNLYKTNPAIPMDQINTLRNNIISTFKDYPMPMYDLLLQLKNVYLRKGTPSDFNNYVVAIKGILTSEENKPNIGSIAKAMLQRMPGDGLLEGYIIVPGTIQIDNVWNGGIATISINGPKKEISVSPQGSYTNLNGWGEAFKISLEKANGDVIASLVVNHQESNPGAAIEKAFNNKSFEFGDKLVIDYVGSSQITAHNIITNDGIVANYKISKPANVFYITKNGLSLTPSGNSRSITVPVSIKNSKGDILGNVSNLTGETGHAIIVKDLKVPSGYNLESVMLNNKIIYTGNNLVNAQYAIAQQKYASNEAIQINVIKINTINFSGLKDMIANGESKLSSGILYTMPTINVLNNAIASGKNVLANTKATQAEIDAAMLNIQTAIKGLKEWCNVSEDLTNAISKAEGILSKGTNDGNLGYTKDTEKALESAINSAQALMKSSNITSKEASDAIANLTNSENALKSNVEPLKNVLNTAKAKQGNFTPSTKGVLDTAIENAEKILNSNNPSLANVKTAVDSINAALNGLKESPSATQNNALTNIIKKANNIINDGVKNGCKGYTNSSKANLINQINNGKKLESNPNASATDVESAISSINNAINGLKVNTVGLQTAINNGQSKVGIYTKDSQTALNNAIASGEKVLKNSKATPLEVKNATDAINNAIKGLQSAATGNQKSNLMNVINSAEKIIANSTLNGEQGYTDTTKEKVIALINSGKLLDKNPNATEVEITKQITEINNAVNNLVSNTEGLVKVINNAKNKNGSYTKESKEALNTALENAQKVLNNKKATPLEVKQAIDTLNGAIKGLKPEASITSQDALKNLIKTAKDTLNNSIKNGEAGYTKDTKSGLVNAINAANKKIKSQDLTSNDIKTLTDAINTAINNLMPNTVGLQSAISKAKDEQGVFTPSTKSVLDNAILNGEKVLNNKKATPLEVKNATDMLNKATEGLVFGATKNQKDDLSNQINNAQKILEKGEVNGLLGYTNTSKATLVNSINNAKKVLENKDVTPNNIEVANNSIKNAISSLRANKNDLQSEVNTAKNIKGDYTENSKNTLSEALASGEKVLSSNNATPEQVKAAIDSIQSAVKGLEKVTSKPKTDSGSKKDSADTNSGTSKKDADTTNTPDNTKHTDANTNGSKKDSTDTNSDTSKKNADTTNTPDNTKHTDANTNGSKKDSTDTNSGTSKKDADTTNAPDSTKHTDANTSGSKKDSADTNSGTSKKNADTTNAPDSTKHTDANTSGSKKDSANIKPDVTNSASDTSNSVTVSNSTTDSGSINSAKDKLSNAINNAKNALQNTNNTVGTNSIEPSVTTVPVANSSETPAVNTDNNTPKVNSDSISEGVQSQISALQNQRRAIHLNNAYNQSKSDLQNQINNATEVMKNPNSTENELASATDNLQKSTRQFKNSEGKVKESSKPNVDKATSTISTKTNDSTISKDNKNKEVETGVGIVVGLGALGIIAEAIRRKKKRK